MSPNNSLEIWNSNQPKVALSTVELFDKVKADWRIDKKDLLDLEESYFNETKKINTETKKELDELKRFIDFAKFMKNNDNFKNISNLDDVLWKIWNTKIDDKNKIISIFENSCFSLNKDKFEMFISDLEEFDIKSFIENNKNMVFLNQVFFQTKKEEMQTKKEEMQNIFKAIELLDNKPELKNIKEKIYNFPEFKDLKDNDSRKNKLKELFGDVDFVNKVTLLLKSEFDKVKKDPNKSIEEKQKYYNTILEFSKNLDSSNNTWIKEFILEIEKEQLKLNVESKNTILSSLKIQEIASSLKKDSFKKISWNTFEKELDWWNKEQIKIYRDWEVRKKIISSSWYSQDVPFLINQDAIQKSKEIDNKLRINKLNQKDNELKLYKVDTKIEEFKDSQKTLKEKLENNNWTQEEKNKITEELKNIEENLKKLEIIKSELLREKEMLEKEREDLDFLSISDENLSNLWTNKEDYIKSKEKIALNKIEILDKLQLTQFFSQNNLDKLLDALQTNDIEKITWAKLDFGDNSKEVTKLNLKTIMAKLFGKNTNEIFENWTDKLIPPYNEQSYIKQNELSKDPKIIDNWIFSPEWLKLRLLQKKEY